MLERINIVDELHPGAPNITPYLGELQEGEMVVFENALPTGDAGLTEQRNRLTGRSDSACGVWFADIASQVSQGDTTQIQPVAIKPLGPAWHAVKEVRTAYAVNEIGTEGCPDMSLPPVTFTPIGILRAEGHYNMVTRFEEGVLSLDNVLNPTENKYIPPSVPEVHTALTYGAINLLFLHGNMVSHGDAQVKNTAMIGVEGRIIDVTTSRLYKTMSPKVTEAFLSDLQTYMASVAKHADYHGATDEMIADAFAFYIDSTPEIFGQESGMAKWQIGEMLKSYKQKSQGRD